MAVQYSEIQELLRSRADLNAREAHEIRKGRFAALKSSLPQPVIPRMTFPPML